MISTLLTQMINHYQNMMQHNNSENWLLPYVEMKFLEKITFFFQITNHAPPQGFLVRGACVYFGSKTADRNRKDCKGEREKRQKVHA